MQKVTLSYLLLLVCCLTNISRIYGTIPPYHWINDYLRYFKLRGYFSNININDQPFKREDIAVGVFNIYENKENLSTIENEMLSDLYREFYSDIQICQKDTSLALLRYGINLRGFSDTAPNRDLVLNTKLGLNINRQFILFSTTAIKNDKVGRGYEGKKLKEFYGFAEQGYLLYRSTYLDIKLGRDYLRFGPGDFSTLLISENAGSFDQYNVSLKYKGINFSFWGILLDGGPRNIFDKYVDQKGDTLNLLTRHELNRYLNGHRLSMKIKDKLYFAISEVAVYGGYEKNWNWEIFNPFVSYLGVNINDSSVDVNAFISLDFSWYLNNNKLFYGEFLIDDYQIEKKVTEDLEPNELGLIIGLKWADIFKIKTSIMGFEYTQIRNRTYNSPKYDWEKYLYNGEYIGHSQGNNFEKFDFDFSFYWSTKIYNKIKFSYLKKGEEAIKAPFNKDYLKYDIGEGYSEPFPYGIVDYNFSINYNLEYYFDRNIRLSFYFNFSNHNNYQNESNVDNKRFYIIGTRIWIDFTNLNIL